MFATMSIESFTSAPIRLAAAISKVGRRLRDALPKYAPSLRLHAEAQPHRNREHLRRNNSPTFSSLVSVLAAVLVVTSGQLVNVAARAQETTRVNSMVGQSSVRGEDSQASVHVADQQLRHRTHYMQLVPSSHFSYKEGRQLGYNDDSQPVAASGFTSKVNHPDHTQNQPTKSVTGFEKRSSALLSSSSMAVFDQRTPQYSALVGSMPIVEPLRRRMMSESQSRWTQLLSAGSESVASDDQLAEQHFRETAAEPADLMVSASNQQLHQQQQQQQQQPLASSSISNSPTRRRRQKEAEDELLRQKSHIQYHDGLPWSAVAAKCHKRTLNFCASVLPFNTTTFPNIIGDNNRFEVKRSLPFFGFLAKSSCNKRLDELLCLLLEPPCSARNGVAIPPCKKFCRLALEGCNEYIPATLAMSSVFDCRQYPDSNDPNVCINLAQEPKCSADEFRCPDKTCIPTSTSSLRIRALKLVSTTVQIISHCEHQSSNPGTPFCTNGYTFARMSETKTHPPASHSDRKQLVNCKQKSGNWLCDGVRDCVFAADEANCTETVSGPQFSVCSTEEFKCDAKCVPKAWRCDGERDCLDGADEEGCNQRPRCGQDRFRCADGNGCIPKRWVCDGKAECRDGSDEMSCESRQCSDSDFRCDNGICIPKIWRCDRQHDCKDGSDERQCVYPTTSAPITTTISTTTAAPTTTIITTSGSVTENIPSQSNTMTASDQSVIALTESAEVPVNAQLNFSYPLTGSESDQQQQQQQQNREPANTATILDVVRIIKQESASMAPSSVSPIPMTTISELPHQVSTKTVTQVPLIVSPASNDMRKFDYDLIASQSSEANAAVSSLPGDQVSNYKQATEISSHRLPEVSQAFRQKQFSNVPHIEYVPHQQETRPQVAELNPNPINGLVNQYIPHGFSDQPEPRVPIYRSLLKSLKGGQRVLANGRQVHQMPNGRYAIARRRRERIAPRANAIISRSGPK